MDDLLLTVKDAQRVLRLGRTKIYALIGAGELDAVHVGRARRITASSLRAFADRLTRRAAR